MKSGRHCFMCILSIDDNCRSHLCESQGVQTHPKNCGPCSIADLPQDPVPAVLLLVKPVRQITSSNLASQL